MATTPSIAMIPAGYKALKLYSQLPVNGDGDLDVARASSATRVNQDGLIELMANNVPRLDYSDGSCPSLLLEPQSTNLITYSEDFSNVAWAKGSLGTGITPVISSNFATSPMGDLTADRIQLDLNGGIGASDFSTISQTVTVTSGATTTKSLYFKSNTTNNYNIIVYDAQFNTGAIPVTVGQSWVRIDLTDTVPSTSSSIVFGLRNNYGVLTDDIADILVWGAQLEEQSYATSYIPTSGATVTRLEDVVDLDLTPFSLTSITETFSDGSTNVITTIPTTYEVSKGKISSIIAI